MPWECRRWTGLAVRRRRGRKSALLLALLGEYASQAGRRMGKEAGANRREENKGAAAISSFTSRAEAGEGTGRSPDEPVLGIRYKVNRAVRIQIARAKHPNRGIGGHELMPGDSGTGLISSNRRHRFGIRQPLRRERVSMSGLTPEFGHTRFGRDM